MTVMTACRGAIAGVGSVRTFSIEESVDIKTLGASNTRCANAKKGGTRSWAGSYGAYGCLPAMLPGLFYQLDGSTGPGDNLSLIHI